MSAHLVRAIEELKRGVLFLGAVVESQLQQAVDAVGRRDASLATRVISSDTEIDQLEVEIEDECLKILALHHPVAQDLRFVVAVIKLNNDLERVGDLAVNIAEHALYLATHDPVTVPDTIRTLSRKAAIMLKNALDALVKTDSALARRVCAADDEVDDLNRLLFDEVEERIRDCTDNLDSNIRLLSISRQLERVGDHATNIAEDVIYMTEGQIIRHAEKAAQRRK
jgi:phosphate transport system protein